MSGPFPPNDDLVGAITHALAVMITSQLGVAQVYEKLPDRQPLDNSVILPLTKIKVKDETNGKQSVLITFTARHLFRRKSMPDNIAQAYTYLHPWLLMLAAGGNQSLGGLAREINATEVQVTQVSEQATPMLALVVSFDVLTEYNIPN